VPHRSLVSVLLVFDEFRLTHVVQWLLCGCKDGVPHRSLVPVSLVSAIALILMNIR